MNSSRVTNVSTDNLNGSDNTFSESASDIIGNVSVITHHEVSNVRHSVFAVLVGCILLQLLLDHRRLHEFIHSDEGLSKCLFVVSIFVAFEFVKLFDEVISDPSSYFAVLCLPRNFICSFQSHIIKNIELNITIESNQHALIILELFIILL